MRRAGGAPTASGTQGRDPHQMEVRICDGFPGRETAGAKERWRSQVWEKPRSVGKVAAVGEARWLETEAGGEAGVSFPGDGPLLPSLRGTSSSLFLEDISRPFFKFVLLSIAQDSQKCQCQPPPLQVPSSWNLRYMCVYAHE